MKRILQIFTLVLIASTLILAQRAKIKNVAVSPHQLTTLGLTSNSVSTGLDVVPNQTYVYLAPQNIGNSDPIVSSTFEFVSRPSGSAAAIEVVNAGLVQFKTDVKGTYEVKLTITTAAGSDDTTKVITAGDFVGVGNFEGVAAQWPQCMSCHGGSSKFTTIFDKWKVSGHANVFKREVTTSDHYGTNCMKCHTTGYDHNVTAVNGGFDDVAAQLGWVWVAPAAPSQWENIKTNFPKLVNFATIGCESCHGPGSQHGQNPSGSKLAINLEDGTCASCHDEPWRHNKVAEYENSGHSHALWSSSFAQGATSQDNSLQNCIRCHDAKGYVNYTKGLTTNTTGMNSADHVAITCATCHDPHGNENVASLRVTPASGDTLANGFNYGSIGGLGQTCMSCHKSRRNAATYAPTTVSSSHWGPHHSVQTDVLLGQNAAEFGTPYVSGSHKFAVQDACVTCHMAETTADGTPTRDKVGGHSMKLHNEENNYYHTKGCEGCHGPKTGWDDFVATSDYDGNGQIQSIPKEIDGLLTLLRTKLPPEGLDSINTTDIKNANNVNINKAYFNYQLIAYDGSKGMHNAKFAINVLTRSITAIGGVIPVELISFNASAANGNVILTWETATETNNNGFEVERKSGKEWTKIGFIKGNGTTTELKKYSFVDKNVTSKSVYRLRQIDFDGTAHYSKEVEVSVVAGPKDYSISQNYPNPFNPTTTIKYSVPFESNVKILVYNLTGEVVAELVNTVKPAGSFDAVFDLNKTGATVSSGIYFYSIEANAVDGSASFRQTRKMVLLK